MISGGGAVLSGERSEALLDHAPRSTSVLIRSHERDGSVSTPTLKGAQGDIARALPAFWRVFTWTRRMRPPMWFRVFARCE